MPTTWLKEAISTFAGWFPDGTYLSQPWMVQGLVAVLLGSLICGMVGSQVIGNRMSFFADALAHCAFAGVAIGFLVALAAGMESPSDFDRWLTPIMVGFGILMGLAIAFVRENTSLASDTVIGVFFAGAMGLGAMLRKGVTRFSRKYRSDDFMFGDPLNVTSEDLLILLVLLVITASFVLLMYNSMVFASFNASLARSRNVPLRLYNYLFIVLLGLIVNLCLVIFGALLIIGMLIVPAATAANVSRNMRQMFWTTTGLSLLVGFLGHWLSYEVSIPLTRGAPLEFGPGGTIVLLSVVLFFTSMALAPWLRGRQA